MQTFLKTCDPRVKDKSLYVCVCNACQCSDHEKHDLKLKLNELKFKSFSCDGRNSCTRAVRTLRKTASTSLYKHIRTLWHSVFNYSNPSVGITVKYLLRGRKRGRAQEGNSGWKGKAWNSEAAHSPSTPTRIKLINSIHNRFFLTRSPHLCLTLTSGWGEVGLLDQE